MSFLGVSSSMPVFYFYFVEFQCFWRMTKSFINQLENWIYLGLWIKSTSNCFVDFVLGLNIHLIPIFIVFIQFGSYFRFVFN